MADGQFEPRKQQLITEIEAIHNELYKLKVIPEKIQFAKLEIDDLEMELEAVTEQLKTRKRFLRITNMPVIDEKKSSCALL